MNFFFEHFDVFKSIFKPTVSELLNYVFTKDGKDYP